MNRAEILQKLSDMLSDRCTPENITSLQPNEVFVFGSKPNGEHKSGAAKTAVEKFGAVEGKAEGMSGQSYAIPVHRHRIEEMSKAVARFIEYARVHAGQYFYVLPIGCGNANMDVAIVAKMFKQTVELDNVYLPAIFINTLKLLLENNYGISSSRYHGRWYGVMFCLGEQSGRDMKEKLKDKATEIITMLEISNEFPKEFNYVKKLLALEKEKEQIEEELPDEERQKDYILGAIEAKKVYLEDKKWERLLADTDNI